MLLVSNTRTQIIYEKYNKMKILLLMLQVQLQLYNIMNFNLDR